MINPTPPSDPSSDTESTIEPSLETCDSVMICLSTRRFVIVYPDEAKKDLWPIDGGWDKVRQLRVGDQVVFKGSPATVRAMEVYR